MVHILGTGLSVLAGLVFGGALYRWLSRWMARGSSSPCGCGGAPILEIAVGAIWGVLAWRLLNLLELVGARFGDALPYLNLEYTAAIMLFCGTLVGIAMLDADHFPLSDFVTLPGIAVGVVFYALTTQQVIRVFMTESTPWRQIGERLAAVLAAGGFVLVIRLACRIFRRQQVLGWGEAHLMAMLAAWLGLPGALLAFGIGLLIGTCVLFAFRIVPKLWRMRERPPVRGIPVGAYVSAGGIVSCLWGPQILLLSANWSELPKLALKLF